MFFVSFLCLDLIGFISTSLSNIKQIISGVIHRNFVQEFLILQSLTWFCFVSVAVVVVDFAIIVVV